MYKAQIIFEFFILNSKFYFLFFLYNLTSGYSLTTKVDDNKPMHVVQNLIRFQKIYSFITFRQTEFSGHCLATGRQFRKIVKINSDV